MRVVTIRCLALLIPLVLVLHGCTDDSSPTGSDDAGATGRVLAVADAYVDGYFNQFPEEAYEVGYPNIPWHRFGDRSVTAMADWHAREEAWLEELRGIDPAALKGSEAAIPYAFTRERLEAAIELRVCRIELWNVSPTWTSWMDILSSSIRQQPVGSDAARTDALARIRDAARYLDTEIANLREGLRRGYSAPRVNVDRVVVLVDNLLAGSMDDSPFFEPAGRDEDEAFASSLRLIVEREVHPAVRRYRDFLENEYAGAARAETGVAANPDGEACYQASVRFYTSLPLTPQEIHENGLRQMDSILKEMQAIAERSFDTSDIQALLELVRVDPRYTFETRQGIVDYAQAAVDRAKAAAPDWFGFVPKAEVVIRPYPEYQKRTGGGFYSSGSVDGTRPGTYQLGTYEPRKFAKAGLEATAFHETYPGHHLQVSVGLERSGVHPVLRYFFFSGTGEGWALYTERLAEEMGIYSSDLDLLGLLSNEALRAARLVVDPGMHVLGWSRQQGIDYLMNNTALSEEDVIYEINRYLAVPAQADSYMTGSLEIWRLRRLAEERLGEAFDIKVFHDRIIGDGTVTLGMLGTNIDAWIAEQGK